MSCVHFEKGTCLHDGYLCSHCKTAAKKDYLSDVPSANRKAKATAGTVTRKFETKGSTCLTPCHCRPRIKIGSVNCKQCWNLLVYDGEKNYVKCKVEVEK